MVERRRGWLATMAGNARQAYLAGNGRQYGKQYSGGGGGLSHICLYAILLALASRAILRNHDLSGRGVYRSGSNKLSSVKNPSVFIIGQGEAGKGRIFIINRFEKLFFEPSSPFWSHFGEGRYWIGKGRAGGCDLCLNLFTENKTHQIWSGGPKRPPRRAPSTQLTTILFVFTYGPASDKKMPHDISRFYTRTVLP